MARVSPLGAERWGWRSDNATGAERWGWRSSDNATSSSQTTPTYGRGGSSRSSGTFRALLSELSALCHHNSRLRTNIAWSQRAASETSVLTRNNCPSSSPETAACSSSACSCGTCPRCRAAVVRGAASAGFVVPQQSPPPAPLPATARGPVPANPTTPTARVSPAPAPGAAGARPGSAETAPAPAPSGRRAGAAADHATPPYSPGDMWAHHEDTPAGAQWARLQDLGPFRVPGPGPCVGAADLRSPTDAPSPLDTATQTQTSPTLFLRSTSLRELAEFDMALTAQCAAPGGAPGCADLRPAPPPPRCGRCKGLRDACTARLARMEGAMMAMEDERAHSQRRCGGLQAALQQCVAEGSSVKGELQALKDRAASLEGERQRLVKELEKAQTEKELSEMLEVCQWRDHRRKVAELEAQLQHHVIDLELQKAREAAATRELAALQSALRLRVGGPQWDGEPGTALLRGEAVQSGPWVSEAAVPHMGPRPGHSVAPAELADRTQGVCKGTAALGGDSVAAGGPSKSIWDPQQEPLGSSKTTAASRSGSLVEASPPGSRGGREMVFGDRGGPAAEAHRATGEAKCASTLDAAAVPAMQGPGDDGSWERRAQSQPPSGSSSAGTSAAPPTGLPGFGSQDACPGEREAIERSQMPVHEGNDRLRDLDLEHKAAVQTIIRRLGEEHADVAREMVAAVLHAGPGRADRAPSTEQRRGVSDAVVWDSAGVAVGAASKGSEGSRQQPSGPPQTAASHSEASTPGGRGREMVFGYRDREGSAAELRHDRGQELRAVIAGAANSPLLCISERAGALDVADGANQGDDGSLECGKRSQRPLASPQTKALSALGGFPPAADAERGREMVFGSGAGGVASTGPEHVLGACAVAAGATEHAQLSSDRTKAEGSTDVADGGGSGSDIPHEDGKLPQRQPLASLQPEASSSGGVMGANAAAVAAELGREMVFGYGSGEASGASLSHVGAEEAGSVAAAAAAGPLLSSDIGKVEGSMAMTEISDIPGVDGVGPGDGSQRSEPPLVSSQTEGLPPSDTFSIAAEAAAEPGRAMDGVQLSSDRTGSVAVSESAAGAWTVARVEGSMDLADSETSGEESPREDGKRPQQQPLASPQTKALSALGGFPPAADAERGREMVFGSGAGGVASTGPEHVLGACAVAAGATEHAQLSSDRTKAEGSTDVADGGGSGSDIPHEDGKLPQRQPLASLQPEASSSGGVMGANAAAVAAELGREMVFGYGSGEASGASLSHVGAEEAGSVAAAAAAGPLLSSDIGKVEGSMAMTEISDIPSVDGVGPGDGSQRSEPPLVSSQTEGLPPSDTFSIAAEAAAEPGRAMDGVQLSSDRTGSVAVSESAAGAWTVARVEGSMDLADSETSGEESPREDGKCSQQQPLASPQTKALSALGGFPRGREMVFGSGAGGAASTGPDRAGSVAGAGPVSGAGTVAKVEGGMDMTGISDISGIEGVGSGDGSQRSEDVAAAAAEPGREMVFGYGSGEAPGAHLSRVGAEEASSVAAGATESFCLSRSKATFEGSMDIDDESDSSDDDSHA